MGYVVFRLISDESVVEWVNPSVQVPKVLSHPVHAAANWITGVSHSLFGAWLSAVGTIRLDAGSRSTWLALAMGIFSAVVVARAFRGLPVSTGAPRGGRRLWALAAAVSAGLITGYQPRRTLENPTLISRNR